MPGHEQYNARCRRGEASVRVLINAEEVRVQNMTERAKIGIREGSLSESQKCLLYLTQYCQYLYCGHKSKNIGYVLIENESWGSPVSGSVLIVVRRNEVVCFI